ncbi:MAG TPA: hypothetical protein VNT22_00115 [Baekduia sp.]|nr:hypothetical protein [Baekduia sp.]
MAKTQRERDALARAAKLDRIDEQVKEGSLVIRKMSAQEKKKWDAKKDDEAPKTPAERKKAEAAHARRARKKERASSN